MDREKAMRAVKELLEAIGEDVSREGLADTPRRVADAFAEFTSGNAMTAEDALSATFEVDGGEMVLEKDIYFSSTCEHHLMPFFGRMAIAYIPDKRVAGLSKLARCVEVYSRRLQLQERLTAQVAEAIMRCLSPKGVLVWCEAEHTCMTCRGVKKAGSKTVTYKVLGDFSERKITEALALIR
ncbi:MAG: GTP cyclohydrolase I FolE [Clostridia bacterium]|nr:GTP cyclohydrolase I FolE [Clostridia bacterium]